RADIMGHARKGTNALHYSKRVETHGVAQVLAEYRAFMVKQIDVATSDLRPRPVRLLPLRHRSRTGKPRLRLKQEKRITPVRAALKVEGLRGLIWDKAANRHSVPERLIPPKPAVRETPRIALAKPTSGRLERQHFQSSDLQTSFW
ncbi:hypothetical protein SOQ14_03755, partial [Erythrobacter sp. T5W1-R]|uniref:hypothetical protein n=1 Tax=Erythrobacter sp. T5W1-R TaxID=3101752 RepID=UPI002AFF7577